MRNYAQQAIVDKKPFLLIRLFLHIAEKLIFLLTWYAACFPQWGFCFKKKNVYNSEGDHDPWKYQ